MTEELDRRFVPVDLAAWPRRDEFEHFSRSGCGFTMTAEVDITGLVRYAGQRGQRLYPLLVAAAAQAVNAHREFRYGREDGAFGYYEVMHPLFFDLRPSGDVKCLCAPYRPDTAGQAAEIERVRARYRDRDGYQPQGELPQNVVNISCVPWVKLTGLSFSLQYGADYYTPILTFGKYEERGGRTRIPLSVYCNHAVNDGRHCALLFQELQERSEALERAEPPKE